jgi:hypothetical protein
MSQRDCGVVGIEDYAEEDNNDEGSEGEIEENEGVAVVEVENRNSVAQSVAKGNRGVNFKVRLESWEISSRFR